MAAVVTETLRLVPLSEMQPPGRPASRSKAPPRRLRLAQPKPQPLLAAARPAAKLHADLGATMAAYTGNLPGDLASPLADPSYEDIAAALSSIEIPVNMSRKNVRTDAAQVVTGMCLGVVGGYGSGIVVSKHTYSRPKLTATLVNFARKHVGEFPFTSIQVNKNYQSALHVDASNLGPSYIVGVGNYTAGGLWVRTHGEIDCHHKWQQFDGNVPHCTLPYEGTRYTLIFFVQQSYKLLGKHQATSKHSKLLARLNFPTVPGDTRTPLPVGHTLRAHGVSDGKGVLVYGPAASMRKPLQEPKRRRLLKGKAGASDRFPTQPPSLSDTHCGCTA